MILTLEKTEEKLCKLGLVTREIIDKRKREKHFGKPTCFILKKFQRTVREDYRTFFPRPPCWKRFDERARFLFKNGGSQDFPAKKMEAEITVCFGTTPSLVYLSLNQIFSVFVVQLILSSTNSFYFTR